MGSAFHQQLSMTVENSDEFNPFNRKDFSAATAAFCSGFSATASDTIAIISGYTQGMEVSVVEAKNQLSQLIRAVEEGEQVVITRNGHPVAELSSPRHQGAAVQLGGMRDRIRLLPGWDDPIDMADVLDGEV